MTVQVGEHLAQILVGKVFQGTRPDLLWVVVQASTKSIREGEPKNFIAVPVNIERDAVGVRTSFLYGEIADFLMEIPASSFITKHGMAWVRFFNLHTDVGVEMLRLAGLSEAETQ